MSSATQQLTQIRKVALIGGTGQVGSHILTHLLGTGKHQITALTRHASTGTLPTNPNLTVIKVDYDDNAALTSALSDRDFLIITLSARATPTLHSRIVSCATAAKIRWIMPNYFGYGIGDRALSGKADLPANFERYIDDVKSAPGVDYTALVCGFWYEFSLAMGEPWFGFRIRDKSVTMYGDGMKKVNVSTWEDCGRAVAGLLSLPVHRQDATDGGVALEKWRNSGVYISSFLVSQRDILDSLHRVLRTRDSDWTVRYEDVEKRFGDGMRELGEGKMLGFTKALYAGVWRSEGADYESEGGLDNGVLGMEREDLDGATKRAVEMAMGTMGDIEGQFR